AAPFSALPPPGGKPVPSGPTLMSHPAISAAVAGRPRFGVSTRAGAAQPATTSTSAAHARSRVDMLHLAAGGDAPGLDRVAVKDRVGAVLGDESLAFGLHVARVIDRPRLEHGRGAVPAPWQAKARERARPHGLSQHRRHPRASTVGGHLDAANRALTGPREPRDLIQTGARQRHAV